MYDVVEKNASFPGGDEACANGNSPLTFKGKGMKTSFSEKQNRECFCKIPVKKKTDY